VMLFQCPLNYNNLSLVRKDTQHGVGLSGIAFTLPSIHRLLVHVIRGNDKMMAS
jgi:hypothetical protein